MKKRKPTSAELSEVTAKARELRDQAYTMTLNAIKRVLRQNGGKVNVLVYSDIAKGLVDEDELVQLVSCDNMENVYHLYGLQLDSEDRLEFLAFDPLERKGVILQNQCLEYDIIAVADALEFALEDMEC